ncbi:hypothetical protein CcrC1_gp390 [Caulobacter phage C1]|nr:hypothetical protein CcrC1_gp390 [Caulobacter phage C1]UTU08619.1 hypothetical protein CcrC2_gp391 [Caulobacter phage C2]UTU09134.1 hypothetical protein CcrJ4_gp385 [Caulobacter phage J4]UTU10252.1 hypothetical protein CcrRB23_gp390 [Caulobacter phage RB23]WGN97286.1 hypothetical protein [Bertelyvirus sp.]
MPKTIHTVTFADGTTATRESANRKYSHVVVGKHSKALHLSQLDGYARSDRSNYHYGMSKTRATPGVPTPYQSLSERDRPYVFTWTEKEIEDAKIEMAPYADMDAYVAGKRAERLEVIAKREAEGYYDQWCALTWASRHDLAAKQVGNWSKTFVEVTILPTEQREVTPRKKKEA